MNTGPHGVGSVSRRDWFRMAALASAASAFRSPLCAAALDGDATGATLTATQRAAVRGVLEEAVARKAIPGGSLVVLARERVVFREAVGRTELDGGRPFTVETPCMIASVSKPISATYFVLLDERGTISLDDPVEKYLPDFKGIRVRGKGRATNTMRVWHLLSHRSGLPGNADLEESRPPVLSASAGLAETDPRHPDASLENVVSSWAKEGLLAEPGERFAYGRAGYMVAGRLAEVVLGKRFETLLQEALLDPLGMSRTTFHPDAETIQALPARYQSTAAGAKREARPKAMREAGGMVNPAGGLCSRLDDLAAFLALHANRGLVGDRRLVKAESLARMYRPHPPKATDAADGGGAGYGLGWNSIAPGGVARHLGATGTMAWLDLKAGHAGMLLTQVRWGATRALIPRLMREVQAIFPSGGVSAADSEKL